MDVLKGIIMVDMTKRYAGRIQEIMENMRKKNIYNPGLYVGMDILDILADGFEGLYEEGYEEGYNDGYDCGYLQGVDDD